MNNEPGAPSIGLFSRVASPDELPRLWLAFSGVTSQACTLPMESRETGPSAKLLLRPGNSEHNPSFYQVPFYKDDYKNNDHADRMQAEHPDQINFDTGGGKHEQLSHQLRTDLGSSIPVLPAVATVAFMNGGQANMPTWADRCIFCCMYRILEDPSTFLHRYVNAAHAFPFALMSRAC